MAGITPAAIDEQCLTDDVLVYTQYYARIGDFFCYPQSLHWNIIHLLRPICL